MDLILFVLLVVGLIHLGNGQETALGGLEVKHRYACVSPESCRSNMYSIECSVGEKIAMLGMNYGAKPYTHHCASTQACVSKTKCCTHEEGDCLVPYDPVNLFSVYKTCSQATQCGWLFAKSTDLRNTCKFRERSNYVMADFFCVSDNQFIDVCSQHTLTARSVHMHHSAIPPSVYNYRQCSCLITTSDCNTNAKLMFRAIDIRLQSRENLTSCDLSSHVELIGQKGVKRYSCEEGKFLHGLKSFYTTEEQNIALYLHKEHRKYPTKLWLEVKSSEPGVDVKVTCGPRSLQTARRCPTRQDNSPSKFDEPGEVPKGADTSPTVIIIDEADFDPNSPNPDDDGPRDKKNPAIPAILGGVVAGTVVLILLLVLVCLILRRNRNRKKKEMRYSYKVCNQDKEETHQVNYYETVADPDGKHDPTPVNGRHPIYHQPWGAQPGFQVTRAKPSDLAYATSEEIKVLIEKMEKDRQFINEGQQGDHYHAPDPTYYRHIDNYRFRYSGYDAHDDGSDKYMKDENNVEHEAKSNASDNSGTEQMGSEDSKVEADRHMDSDIESQKVESEALIQTYYDGYESPRLSTFHPMALPQRNSFNPGKPTVPVDEPEEQTQNISHVDNKSDDVPVEHAPPVSEAVKKMSESESSAEKTTGDIQVEEYREPDNIDSVGSQGEDAGSGSEEHQYSPVYDEIPEHKTDL